MNSKTGLTLLTLGLCLGLNLARSKHDAENPESKPTQAAESRIETRAAETQTEFRLSIAGDPLSYRGRIARDDIRELIAAVNEWIAGHPETRIERIVCEGDLNPECVTVTLTHERTPPQTAEVPEPMDIPPAPTGQ